MPMNKQMEKYRVLDYVDEDKEIIYVKYKYYLKGSQEEINALMSEMVLAQKARRLGYEIVTIPEQEDIYCEEIIRR